MNIERAAEPRQRIEQKDHIASRFRLAPGVFEHELGKPDLVAPVGVARAGEDLPANAPAHVGDLFGSLVDQEHQEDHRWVKLADRVRELL